MVERESLIALVRGLQKGEEDAAAQLYKLFQNDIYYFILKTVKNDKELAEDLTQDTFVEILETIDKLQEPAAFVTWSKQIAYHKCTAYFRKRKELLVDEDEEGYSVFDTLEEENEEFIPDAAMDKEDLKQTIIAMLDELSEEQRSAILLRYFNEISVKEIAEIQGVTEGTVKSRLNYGRKAIKQSVEDYEKKTGVKLHCAGVLPLLLWLFREYRIDKEMPISEEAANQAFVVTEEVAATAVAATSAVAATTAAASGAAATATTAVAETAVGMGIKIAGSTLATKVIAGITAATVAVGGVTVGREAISRIDSVKPTYTETQEVLSTQMTQSYEESFSPVETTHWHYEETQGTFTDTSGCDHAWERYTGYIDKDHIGTTYQCTNCGTMKQHTEVNPCQHEWEYFKRFVNGYVYEDQRCSKCTAYILRDRYKDTCEHEWELTYEFIGSKYITKEYKCIKCGGEYGENYENTCEHEWQFKEERSNSQGAVDQIWECKNCRLEYYNPQYDLNAAQNCEHEWELTQEQISSEFITEVHTCTKCGKEDVISYANTCEHAWELTYELIGSESITEEYACANCGAKKVESYANTCVHEWQFKEERPNSQGAVDQIWECKNCRLEYYNPQYDLNAAQNCEHEWELTQEQISSEFITEVHTCTKCGKEDVISYANTCEHAWEESSWDDGNMMYIDRTCTTCGAVSQTSEVITPTEATTNDAECEHEWTYNDPVYTATEIQQIRVCTKCGLAELVSITENPCQHETSHSYYADENKIVESDNCTICGANISYSERENPCEHEWTGRTAVDVDVIYEYEDCTKCQFVRLVSETENTCEHVWTTRTFADPNTVCGQEECTSCTAVRDTWEHQWEEQAVVDENGEIIETQYYCPNCTAYQ